MNRFSSKLLAPSLVLAGLFGCSDDAVTTPDAAADVVVTDNAVTPDVTDVPAADVARDAAVDAVVDAPAVDARADVAVDAAADSAVDATTDAQSADVGSDVAADVAVTGDACVRPEVMRLPGRVDCGPRADSATCPTGYECLSMSGVVLQQFCGRSCRSDCDCPTGETCGSYTDKAGTHSLCVGPATDS